jgi:hypothetical protein
MSMGYGWICPKCQAVMAPWCAQCVYCKPKIEVIISYIQPCRLPSTGDPLLDTHETICMVNN